MKANENEDFTTNQNQTAKDAADNEQSNEDQDTAGVAGKQSKTSDNTGSHQEGQYDKQSTQPTMHPDKKVG